MSPHAVTMCRKTGRYSSELQRKLFSINQNAQHRLAWLPFRYVRRWYKNGEQRESDSAADKRNNLDVRRAQSTNHTIHTINIMTLKFSKKKKRYNKTVTYNLFQRWCKQNISGMKLCTNIKNFYLLLTTVLHNTSCNIIFVLRSSVLRFGDCQYALNKRSENANEKHTPIKNHSFTERQMRRNLQHQLFVF